MRSLWGRMDGMIFVHGYHLFFFTIVSSQPFSLIKFPLNIWRYLICQFLWCSFYSVLRFVVCEWKKTTNISSQLHRKYQCFLYYVKKQIISWKVMYLKYVKTDEDHGLIDGCMFLLSLPKEQVSSMFFVFCLIGNA